MPRLSILLRISYSSIAAFILSYCTIAANEILTASGFVFHDANLDGKHNSSEKGIPQIAVSNGIDVVLTDNTGRYQLPVSDDTILFVIKPRDWKPLTDALNLPKVYYIHKPKGSPILKFAGSLPTGALPESVDFALYPVKESDYFKVLVFADPQPYNEQEVEYFEKDILNEIVPIQSDGANNQNPSISGENKTFITDEFLFGLTLGDIVGENPALFHPLNYAISQLGLMWFNIPGNHDVNYDAKTDRYSDETWESIYGPPSYAFQFGQVHFIALDNTIYPPVSNSGYPYDGGLNENQLLFVENYLRHVPSDELVVILFHIPLFDEPYRVESFIKEDRRRLFELLKNHPHTFSLSGHTHTQNHYFFTKEDGWMQEKPHHHYNVGTASGSWWKGELDENSLPDSTMRDGTPNGYTIFIFDGNKYSYDYKVANAPASYQMRIHVPNTVRRAPTDISNEIISVNFFNGSSKARVDWHLSGTSGKWAPMKQIQTIDPDYNFTRLTREMSHNPKPGRTLPFPTFSTHLWAAPLPSDLAPGSYTIEVRVTDLFGRIFKDQSDYEIIE